MQKKFLSSLILVLILNVLVKPFYILGIDAEFLKRIEGSNPGDYGEYFSLVGLTFIFNIFLDLGITNYNTRNIAKSENQLQTQFSGILSLRLFLVLGYLFILALSGVLLGYSSHQFYLLSILGLNQVLVAFILFFRSNLTGLMRFKEDSIISVLDRAILIVICSFILWGSWSGDMVSVELFVWLQTLSYFITFLVSFFLVYRHTNSLKINVDIVFFKRILRRSLPYALLILLMMIYYRVDSVMLERMLPNGKREAALYAQGFRFFEAFTMIGYLFAGLLLPIFAKMIIKKTPLSPMVYLSAKIILAIGFLIGIGCYMYSYDIMNTRYETVRLDLEQSAAAFRFLMVCFVAMCSTYIFGTLLTAKGSLKTLNYVALCGVIINLVLNFYFIHKEGAIGAAKASMITQVLTAIAQVYLAFKILKINVEYKEIFRLIIFVLGIAALSKLQFLDYWMYNILIFFMLGGLWIFISGMIQPKSILLILKERED
jgi:O-antigen/teichoic acid export membrane protein